VKRVYFDNNATTPVAPEVIEAILPYLREKYGNPSSIHTFGAEAGAAVEKARAQVAALLGAHPDEIIFTSGGTESDSTAILSALESYPAKRHVVTTRVEHPAVRSLCAHLRSRGYRVTEVPVDRQGLLDMDALRAALTGDTAICTVMYANNETGVIFPVEKIAELCRERGILFHTDAVQAVGKVPLNLAKSAIDMLSLSGHKLHAPKGIGALYVRRGVRFAPYLRGGHQERGRRAGTENVPGIVGLGVACDLAAGAMSEEQTRVRAMRDRLETELLRRALDAHLNGHPTQRLPNTTNISFEYVEGEAILLRLDHVGIAASSGSACTSGSLEPSHVLRAMGVPFTMAHGSVRFSLSRFNTMAEVDYVIEHVPPIIAGLRAMSPVGRERLKSVAS